MTSATSMIPCSIFMVLDFPQEEKDFAENKIHGHFQVLHGATLRHGAGLNLVGPYYAKAHNLFNTCNAMTVGSCNVNAQTIHFI